METNVTFSDQYWSLQAESFLSALDALVLDESGFFLKFFHSSSEH